jgi:hypothetical protein
VFRLQGPRLAMAVHSSVDYVCLPLLDAQPTPEIPAWFVGNAVDVVRAIAAASHGGQVSFLCLG